MVLAVGLDVVEVSRIERMMRHPRFAERILTPKECELCRTPARIAGRWAAKEAIAKAVGVHLLWHQVEILPDEAGRPVAKVDDPHFNPLLHRIHLTISHERHLAAAVAILESV